MNNKSPALASLFALLLAACAITSARADSTSTNANAGDTHVEGSSRATGKVNESSVLDDVYLNYFGTFHGPSITQPGTPYTVNNNGRATNDTTRSPIYFDSEVTTAYMFNNSIGFGPQIQFQATPVLGKGLTLGDYGLKVFDRHFIKYNGFNLYANFYLQAPGGYDHLRGMNYALKTTPALRYDFPHSRFFMGAWTELKDYVGVDAGTTFKVYALPYVAYRVAPTLAFDIGYEMETHHNVGDARYWGLTSYQTDFQPGIVWNVTPKILLNPYLQVFTGTSVTSDATALGAVVSASL